MWHNFSLSCCIYVCCWLLKSFCFLPVACMYGSGRVGLGVLVIVGWLDFSWDHVCGVSLLVWGRHRVRNSTWLNLNELCGVFCLVVSWDWQRGVVRLVLVGIWLIRGGWHLWISLSTVLPEIVSWKWFILLYVQYSCQIVGNFVLSTNLFCFY